MANNLIVLGIESTCDETGVGILQNGKILANEIASSADEHARFGGVIPEIASRAHLEALRPTLDRALNTANIDLNEIDVIAVSAGPGLAGCLATGVSFAKGLAFSLGCPLFGVNHVAAHIFVNSLVFDNFVDEFIGLVVSGGHTAIIKVAGKVIEIIGSTTDDAAGECFDKIGRLLGLDYPAGPQMDEMSKKGDENFVQFPKGYTQKKHFDEHRFDFSFSGLKTAVARYIGANLDKLNSKKNSNSSKFKYDIIASLSKAVTEVLVKKTLDAAQYFNIKTICIGGGFSANSYLRSFLQSQCLQLGYELFIPPVKLCTDNGVMVAKLGEILFTANKAQSPKNFSIDSSMSLKKLYMN
ncbi:MAG: tRNA (adenosine(37)-N6)-threonylcarbamoyltransferase complex transferase subunit TsaD [Bifidobacteriaceae bacterium]|jgi:N6-L-threonylcarbamoyladenine synthase|nr:tRNA (adenosine(37)-N6)-threonylcarbamoyltransferase complex transferase subunit TsaD [Bifidobacteriaceae bacterium]